MHSYPAWHVLAGHVCRAACKSTRQAARPRGMREWMSDPSAITHVGEHVARIQQDGYTVIERAIEPALIDALAEDLLRLERHLGIVPAKNRFEGRQTLRIYNLLVHGELYQR